jgi:uncharacterized protein (TIGR03067 family)
MLVKSLCLGSLLIVALLQTPGEEQAKKDLQKMQGTWTIAAMEVDGINVPPAKLMGSTLVIKGDRYEVQVKDTKTGCTLKLDASKKPCEIDMVFAQPGGADKVHKGIYQFDGDKLVICRGLNANQERPGQFATWPNTGVFVITWQRQVK